MLSVFSLRVVIIAGPFILKSSISLYSNNKIVASGISVTPKLDIKIGRLDYDIDSIDGQSTHKDFQDQLMFRGQFLAINRFYL